MTEPETDQPDTYSTPRPAWVWPLRVPADIGARTLQASQRLGDMLGPLYRWVVAGALIGGLPLLLDWATGWPASRLLTALLLTPFLLAALTRDSLARGLCLVAAAFAAHSALAITLTACRSDVVASLVVEGEDYWTRSERWIRTGQSREYDVGWWLPAHLLIFGAAALFSYLSLGFITLWQGLYEVDLMNYYVGRLLLVSDNPWLALVVGWHVWSLCRGVGYLFLTFEVASLSLERLGGVRLSDPARRRRRWLLAVGFLTLDGVLKYCLLESTRWVLWNNLR
jgi:hypothetical protein